MPALGYAVHPHHLLQISLWALGGRCKTDFPVISIVTSRGNPLRGYQGLQGAKGNIKQ